MYFAVGWPKLLQVVHRDSHLVHISANCDRMLFVVLTQSTIGIWFCKPAVEIVSYRRSSRSIGDLGTNEMAQWKPDSSKLAVTTSKGYIIFYQIEFDKNNAKQTIFRKREDRPLEQRDDLDCHYVDCVPALTITMLSYLQVPGSVTGLVCLREELLVSTGRGILQRIRWSDGLVNSDLTIELASVPFSADLHHSRSSQLSNPDICIKALKYSPLLGGFTAVLSNGRAAFITARSLKFEPNEVVGVWSQEVTGATTTAVNHKYALMAFGCTSGEGVVCHLDELTGALVLSHRLVISSKDYPDASQVCGAVSQMKWTPDGTALALSWERGGFSVWSVFGSLLLLSIGIDTGQNISESNSGHPKLKIKSMEWGSEGYYLWMVCERLHGTPPDGTTNSSEHSGSNSSVGDPSSPSPPQSQQVPGVDLIQLQFIKSSLAVNRCMTNHIHLLLQGEDRLYLNPEESSVQVFGSSPSLPQQPPSISPTAFVGNKQWHVMHIPHTYLMHNWPIRYAAMSMSGHNVAVAGKTGLAHYSLSSRKWKLFGNETQERDMVVTSGGLTWWRDFICVACYNLLDQRDEIRFYPRDCKLDNTFAHVTRIPSQVLLMNTYIDLLIVLCADCHIVLYSVQQKRIQHTPTIALNKIQEFALNKIQEFAIENFVPHPANVVALMLTSLRTDAGSAKVASESKEAESILINVAGRLLLFQTDRSASAGKAANDREKWLTFNPPVIVASSVESMWLNAHSSHLKPHLTEALWLGCGAAGMKVWLPLQPKDEGIKSKGFLSKRIMLPFTIDIYPLAMLFEAGIILGANSESVSYPSHGDAPDDCWPYLQLERTSQVYLHHILRQLLRRNLGVHALEVARSCTDLPYFPHVLELLIHEVLEEEATSKEPIPDALLPRVVAFVEEFPEYLQTIAHCARKSDVAVWQYFFTVVGNPVDLFQECLMSKRLYTAASYLIILQNLEKSCLARQHASLLLDAALEQFAWDLARDLIRFLSAIDPADDEESSTAMRRVRQNSTSKYPVHYPSPPVTPEDSDPYMYPPVVRGRSISKDDPGKDSTKAKEKSKTFARGDSFAGSKSRHTSGGLDSPDKMNVDAILNRHACRLLSSYRLFDLACFAANLEDYQLVSWLRKERLRSAKIDDFVSALKKLHEDFHWPLPILSLGALRHISSVASLESHSSLMDQGSQRSKLEGLEASSASSSADKLTSNSANVSDTDAVGARPEDGSLPPAEYSDAGSLLEEVDSVDSSSWSDAVYLSELDQLSVDLVNRGPAESDLRLRYLFQILVEAGCLEWSALLTLILRDSVLFLRVLTMASQTDAPPEAIVRLNNGLAAFETWTNTDCPGYRPFQIGLQPHIAILKDIKPKSCTSTQRINLPKCTNSFALDESFSKFGRSSENEVGSQLKCERNMTDAADVNHSGQEKSDQGCVVS